MTGIDAGVAGTFDFPGARGSADACRAIVAVMPALLMGDLDAHSAAAAMAHIDGCAACSNEWAAYRRLGGAMDAVLETSDAAPPTLRLPGAGPVAWWARIESPIGPLLIAASEEGLCELTFEGFRDLGEVRDLLAARGFDARPAGPGMPIAAAATLEGTRDQLVEYFGGSRTRFGLPLDFRGITPFTRSVLAATADVPFGRLETYRGIAGKIGKPGASRAVGNALGRNPIPVIVPCHRVVATGGGIGGYTGGLAIKERLLAIERITLG